MVGLGQRDQLIDSGHLTSASIPCTRARATFLGCCQPIGHTHSVLYILLKPDLSTPALPFARHCMTGSAACGQRTSDMDPAELVQCLRASLSCGGLDTVTPLALGW